MAEPEYSEIPDEMQKNDRTVKICVKLSLKYRQNKDLNDKWYFSALQYF